MIDPKLLSEIDRILETGNHDCLSLLHDLVACRSYSGREDTCAAVLLQWFAAGKIPAMTDQRGSVAAFSVPGFLQAGDFPENCEEQKRWVKNLLETCRNRRIKILAYNAHMDVVEAENPEQWTSPPFVATHRDGRVYGRGTCDMKGALAAMATSLLLAKKLDPFAEGRCLLIGCFCCEEEAGEGLAFKELCEELSLHPDMVLLGEPSQMQIARGQRGKLEFFVETAGRCAHTSVPEAGVNAAYKLARALLAIERFDARERDTWGLAPDTILKRNTVVATSIQSWPSSRSFVPDRARIHVTARTALGYSLEQISTALQKDPEWPQDANLVPLVYNSPSYRGKVSEWPSDHSAWETSVDTDFFKMLQESYLAVFGYRAPDKIWPFSTDGVYSAGMAKIPTLGLGPGVESCAHIVDEWVEEKQLLDALKIYSLLPFGR